MVKEQKYGASYSQAGEKHGYSLCTGPILVSSVVRVQIISFVDAGCWGTAMSTGYTRTDTNNLLQS